MTSLGSRQGAGIRPGASSTTCRAYRRQVDVTGPPCARHEGAAPVLDDCEIDAVVAILETLTDASFERSALR